MAERQLDEAIRLYKKAIQASPDGCAPCQISLSKAYHASGSAKNAVASAEAAIALLRKPSELAAAWNQKAMVQLAAAEKSPEKLRAAEASFREALSLDDRPVIRFNLGVALLRQGRDADGIAELERFAAAEPDSPRAKTARDYIENPRRAREPMLPSLELRTLAGELLTDETLQGKVVLLDFWATWCAPCRASVPSLRALVGRSTGQPLVVISLSVDQDEKALRSFLAENGMSWNQVWDRERLHVTDLGVTGYPTYILADHEGVIVFRHSGWGEAAERAVESELRRAISRAKRASRP
jgi:thiol-disulfide isomerase/thioredoxin